eukprot:TRINITY_DN15073_c0_g1_i1.p1 TRINITY_DN15073_c0_g1~~TRINITY_DN15073_c0_g1_i1.p1  ORF type:complete len:426 (+),score=85.61 TRINITY_DN15073_c0_g1_i1:1030-2307(+)
MRARPPKDRRYKSSSSCRRNSAYRKDARPMESDEWRFVGSVPRDRMPWRTKEDAKNMGLLIGLVEGAVEDLVASEYAAPKNDALRETRASIEFGVRGFRFDGFPIDKLPLGGYLKGKSTKHPVNERYLSALSNKVRFRVECVQGAQNSKLLPAADSREISLGERYTCGMTRQSGTVLIGMGRKGFVQVANTNKVIPFTLEGTDNLDQGDAFRPVDGLPVTFITLPHQNGELIAALLKEDTSQKEEPKQPPKQSTPIDDNSPIELLQSGGNVNSSNREVSPETESIMNETPSSIYGLVLSRLMHSQKRRRELLVKYLPTLDLSEGKGLGLYNHRSTGNHLGAENICSMQGMRTYRSYHPLRPSTPSLAHLPHSLRPAVRSRLQHSTNTPASSRSRGTPPPVVHKHAPFTSIEKYLEHFMPDDSGCS